MGRKCPLAPSMIACFAPEPSRIRWSIKSIQQRLGQRDEQHAFDDNRQCGSYFSDPAGDEEQGRERRHQSENRENQGILDPPRAPNGRHHSRKATLALVVDIFGHHDGIVDDDRFLHFVGHGAGIGH